MLISIDPGLNGCGAAMFEQGRLQRVWYIPNTIQCASVLHRAARMGELVWQSVCLPLRCPEMVVVEWPHVYRGGLAKGDPGDLLALAAVAGAVAGLALRQGTPRVLEVEARDWKGQASKQIMAARVMSRLTIEEIQIVKTDLANAPNRFHHNTFDAIGIGLWQMKR